MEAIPYKQPQKWIAYNYEAVNRYLVEASAAVLALKTMPIQKDWAEKMQVVQLKIEVKGTSRIEGADFTEDEFNAATENSDEKLYTRSQKQAAAAMRTYRWIATLPTDRKIDKKLVLDIHRHIVTGADDDRCEPGALRKKDENVTFGSPRHRGANGGEECEKTFDLLCQAVCTEFRSDDYLIQALAAHYHLAAIHPFLDGNGRTARALEALMLQRAGLKDMLFIAMSNYYYDEKDNYLKTLAEVRAKDGDLTSFLIFGLKGVKLQCDRLLNEVKKNVLKSLFLNLVEDLFFHLQTARKRVIHKRQRGLLELLLEKNYKFDEITAKTKSSYELLKDPTKTLIRDINYLIKLGTITAIKLDNNNYELSVRLEWATEITRTEFYKRVKDMPKAKTHLITSMD